MMLSAASITNNATRIAMIAQVHGYASSSMNDTVFSGYYNPTSSQGSVIVENGTFSGGGDNSYVHTTLSSAYVINTITVDLP